MRPELKEIVGVCIVDGCDNDISSFSCPNCGSMVCKEHGNDNYGYGCDICSQPDFWRSMKNPYPTLIPWRW